MFYRHRANVTLEWTLYITLIESCFIYLTKVAHTPGGSKYFMSPRQPTRYLLSAHVTWRQQIVLHACASSVVSFHIILCCIVIKGIRKLCDSSFRFILGSFTKGLLTILKKCRTPIYNLNFAKSVRKLVGVYSNILELYRQWFLPWGPLFWQRSKHNISSCYTYC